MTGVIPAVQQENCRPFTLTQGFYINNRVRFVAANWGDIVRGLRFLVVGVVLSSNGALSVFESFTTFLAQKITLTLDPISSGFLAFLEVLLLIFLLTELPVRYIFGRCKKCGMVFMKIGVPVSSWDSEHSFEHRHCPRCGNLT